MVSMLPKAPSPFMEHLGYIVLLILVIVWICFEGLKYLIKRPNKYEFLTNKDKEVELDEIETND